ncbi:ATP-dependent RNA helicase HrpA [Catenovulum sp. SM1970]|uniref:ATP-dependent RNA helicase HrpA n=1 Tax=Marinifaba aquimaris TaxID=2741323 RepID=UPI001573F3F3|nr:ATP-dependent RNA helicase HrpA [Marinifaba aquimaris]NTS77360.1 ATP-dependent RNA helicase HrpA [Marinifaba aquimaris]
MQDCYGADKFRLKRQRQNILKKQNQARTQDANISAPTDAEIDWLLALQTSIEKRQLRQQNLPDIEYPENLPVSGKKQEIIELIKNNQVVIIAGETGSGKTTQLPKMCLQAGCGTNGFIGHTQPRRLAARSVCNRIAEELKCEVGQEVGFKVRFSDHVNDNSYIKLMTDGILLTEMQHDRFLNQYDTIIIDEAHERSLNIDFILGYLKQLIDKRKDLKIIITSATIDVERFSKHFNNAPVIEVSGRTYPVEVRYKDPTEVKGQFDGEDDEQMRAIFESVDELQAQGPGDILIFLNGEREIRDTAQALEKRKLRHSQILPLYARLSAAEQNLVFKGSNGRRIILATNVAETSLTVPGIRYVIDPGTARISRYSYRTKVQRLPIEAVSQASANQRKGRCGRVAEGICIRLYSEDDFNGRPEFTDPEILRTNLASVIIQMLALGLGDIDKFPFIQAPDNRSIQDGINLLLELGAVKRNKRKGKGQKNSDLTLTELGRQIAKLPIDPRLARMLITANQLNCLNEVMVIVTGLSIQDPRERPHDFKQKSDEAHEKYLAEQSDFISYLNLWQHVKELQQKLTGNQFRKACKQGFLSYLRLREWQDLVAQVKQSARELKFELNANPGSDDDIHKSLLTGLLSHLGMKDTERGYLGARNSRFHVFPGSGLFKKQPKWIMSAELVETSKLYARNNASIDVSWVEPYAQHLVKKSYDEPHFEKKRQSVIALETQKLYGLAIVNRRRVQYGKIDPQLSHELFIREALINRQINFKDKFIDDNNRLIDEINLLEDKARRRDILIDEEDLFLYYASKIPADISNTASFRKWWLKTRDTQPQYLHFKREELMQHDAEKITKFNYPDKWQQGNLNLNLEYVFEPNQDDDGINVIIPLPLLNQVKPAGFDWTIPAYRHDLITALIKSLPKAIRRNFVPAPTYANAVLESIEFDEKTSLLDAVSKALLKMSGTRIEKDSWDLTQIPSHLTPTYKVVDEHNKTIAFGKSLDLLKQNLQGKVKKTLSQVAEKGIEQNGLTAWPENVELPVEYIQKRGNYEVKAFPALHDEGKTVAVKLFDEATLAEHFHLKGLVRLVCLNIPSPVSHLQNKLPNKAKLGLYFNPFGQVADLIQDCVEAVLLDFIAKQDITARNALSFEHLRDYCRTNLADSVLAVAEQVERVLTCANQVQKKIKGKASFDTIQAHADIKLQIDTLIFKGFVCFHGIDKLKDLERYMQALLKRAEKLAVDPVRDRLNRDVLESVGEQAKPYLSLLKQDRAKATEVMQLFYMIQELRVSLFAQNLGTAYPISAKRISAYIKELAQTAS